VHEYQSYCVLKSPHGAMEGQYIFTLGAGTFTAQIPRFELEVDAEPSDA
jgi:ApaG protein